VKAMDQYSSLESLCLKVFLEVAKVTSIFVLPLFLGRIFFSNITGQGQNAFTILKAAVTYFCLIALFPYILEILFSIPESYLPRATNVSEIATEYNNTTGTALLPFALDRILEVVIAVLYWCAYYLHILFMLVMCSMAPIVILSSTMIGMGLGIEVFMGLLIAGSSWPIIWHAFDQVAASLIGSQSDTFAIKCLEILITLFKAFAPMAFASIAVKSPAGKAISNGIQAASLAGGPALAATGFVAGAAISAPGKLYQNLQNRQNHNSSNSTNSNFKSGQRQDSAHSKYQNKKPPSSRLEKAKEQQEEKKE
jgi:hypothetical protein